MKVNKKTDLAIRILKYLVAHNNQEFIAGSIIADELSISYNHLRRIAPLLNRLGFIESKMGKEGGMRLSKNAMAIPLRYLMQATELSSDCINDCATCPFNDNCRFEKHTKLALQAFCDYFANIYLNEL